MNTMKIQLSLSKSGKALVILVVALFISASSTFSEE